MPVRALEAPVFVTSNPGAYADVLADLRALRTAGAQRAALLERIRAALRTLPQEDLARLFYEVQLTRRQDEASVPAGPPRMGPAR